jgi:hypothetical protein
MQSFIVMLGAVMLSVVMLNVVALFQYDGSLKNKKSAECGVDVPLRKFTQFLKSQFVAISVIEKYHKTKCC